MNTQYFKQPLLTVAILSLASLVVGFTACGDDDDNVQTQTPPSPVPSSVLDTYSTEANAIKANYASIAYASYEDSYNEAKELQVAINTFVNTPTEANFDNAKAKWLEAREPYGQTEAYRFANGPIDDADGPEGALNAWPLDEGYIDYIRGGVDSGIVANTSDFPNLTETVLAMANEDKSEKNISIGYHAIEFLLWGQDDANASLLTKGSRAYTDYVDGSMGTNGNQARRREYLKTVSDILVDDLKSMVDEWAPNTNGNYRSIFESSSNTEVLRNILTAIGTLSKSELAGERMFVALKNQDQEDEHSCFSDNTHRDIILNAQGIRNVYIGEYRRVDGSTIRGTSIQDLITRVNSSLAGEMNELSSKSVSDAEAIPVPFDNALNQETISGNGPIMTSVRSLQSQGDKIAEIATALGLQINTELPE